MDNLNRMLEGGSGDELEEEDLIGNPRKVKDVSGYEGPGRLVYLSGEGVFAVHEDEVDGFYSNKITNYGSEFSASD